MTAYFTFCRRLLSLPYQCHHTSSLSIISSNTCTFRHQQKLARKRHDPSSGFVYPINTNRGAGKLRVTTLVPVQTNTHRCTFMSTKLFSSLDDTSSIHQGQEVETIATQNQNHQISDILREAYAHAETDGILQLEPSLKHKYTADTLISSALEAASFNKGQTAGILNALIASCRCYNSHLSKDERTTIQNNNDNLNPDLAWEIFSTWEECSDEIGLYPDLVTFCTTYSVMRDGIHLNNDNELFYEDCAKQVLERAQRFSKKMAGSKRRRMLAAISRKKKDHVNVKAMDHLQTLQDLYGIDFDVLFENDDLIVLSKPSGMVCYHVNKTTDGKIRKKKKGKRNRKEKNNDAQDRNNDNDEEYKNLDISLEDALIDIGVKLSTLNPDAMGMVHRIDRGTSGCVCLAKNDETHARLVTNFFTRHVKKSYMALVPFHSQDDNNDDTVKTLDDSGTIIDDIGGRPAISKYTIKEALGTAAYKLEVETQTGRKHQIRLHCAKSLARPIFLDPLYSSQQIKQQPKSTKKQGRKKNRQQDTIDNDSNNLDDAKVKVAQMMEDVADPNGHRFFLHASSLRIDEFDVNVSNDVPTWWSPTLSKLETVE